MPALSPDGHSLAYVSDESGRQEVYVRVFPGPGPRLQVSAGGGSEPRWARSGRVLYYWHADSLIAVDLARPPVLALGRRTLRLQGSYSHIPVAANYDVFPDGGVLLLRLQHQPSQVIVVVNWTAEWPKL